MVVQLWGCEKCGFRYPSEIRLKELYHQCGGTLKSNSKPAKLLESFEPIRTVRLLKRRSPGVK